jgi:hypothetical protein
MFAKMLRFENKCSQKCWGSQTNVILTCTCFLAFFLQLNPFGIMTWKMLTVSEHLGSRCLWREKSVFGSTVANLTPWACHNQHIPHSIWSLETSCTLTWVKSANKIWVHLITYKSPRQLFDCFLVQSLSSFCWVQIVFMIPREILLTSWWR